MSSGGWSCWMRVAMPAPRCAGCSPGPTNTSRPRRRGHFRLFGLHPSPDFDPYAVAALAATSFDQAQQMVDLLARARLIRDHARAATACMTYCAPTPPTSPTSRTPRRDRQAALTRLFDHYLAAAAAAMDTLIPAEQHRRPRIPSPATPTPPMPDPATARTWLDAERATLIAVSAYSAAYGWPSLTTRLATTLCGYLVVGGHFSDGLTILTYALRVARHTGESAAEVDALLNLGYISWQRGHFQQAADHLQQALSIAREIGDRLGEARALLNLGTVYWWQGHYPAGR